MKLQNVMQILLIIVSLGLLPNVQAVVPAPDGGYPGGNTAEGQTALLSLTTGGFNTAVGFLSLRSNTTSSFNTAIGAGTLLANTADSNTAIGAGALLSNTGGSSNTADGAFALFSNTVGGTNTATGGQALQNNTGGSGNTATGAQALQNNIIGSNNTAYGLGALFNSTGDFNIGLGTNAGTSITTAGNVICIGQITGANVSNSCFIGNIRGRTTVINNAIPVLIDAAGQLGTLSSSRRFKKEIKPMDHVSDAILGLKPVTFHYKSDKTNRPEFGLIAEEVAEVNPDLVVRDTDGEIYTVRYDAVNAMLLNEFLKEHRKVEAQEASITQLKSRVATQETTIAQQQRGMDAVTARLNEQAAQIQKVSAQLDASKPAPQVANNP
jgi:uncharacterized coiled-coil protein SlyX